MNYLLMDLMYNKHIFCIFISRLANGNRRFNTGDVVVKPVARRTKTPAILAESLTSECVKYSMVI